MLEDARAGKAIFNRSHMSERGESAEWYVIHFIFHKGITADGGDIEQECHVYVPVTASASAAEIKAAVSR